MSDNMKLWDAVSKTDPAHTKQVKQRGGFTAIGANYQIKMATEQFGPIGVGWGYEVERFERLDQFVIAHLVFWHGDRSNSFGPIPGCAEMFGGRPDSDAPKKAMTDALTKGLSQLGFNADVFLGKFDDNKYVEEMREEFSNEPPFDATAAKERIAAAMDKCGTYDDLSALWTVESSTVSQIGETDRPLGVQLYNKRDQMVAGFNSEKEAA